ncbi:alcohol dehydrogenase class IV [Chryseomicrobium aureum]|uniref:iron-containing alcohol dehydrogenase n=1 Tax=Chryseomicrobium aureum TaxID=1441723 RepID=UPI0019571C86|nr:iron-containing alcohol dehydrogenase [Chryseomicrobium aureum]MBM7705889.1 alcohol dehydrogenase class IV [Chryseomicrobium aureum]
MSYSQLVFAPLSFTGWGSLEELVPQVEKFNPKRILVITDPMLEKLGLTARATEPLREKGWEVEVSTDVEPEPPLALGERLVKFTREGNFDLVVGFGGGSALDLAKLAAVLAKNEGDVADYLNLTATRSITEKGLPKILIPTTAGTGSEVTNISVLSLDSSKDVIAHEALIADVAIVDPALTVTVPPRVTAATGVDALTHAIEAYVSVNASPTSDALALHAIRLMSRSIRKAVHDGENKEARTAMSHGSYIAGLAFFNAGVAGVHALAYPLGGQFHIPHGESNAVLLPYVMNYIRKSSEKRMRDIFEALGGNAALMSDEEASYACVDELVRLVKDVGIPHTLQEFDIPESAIESLTKDGVKQKRILARSPLPLLEEDIRNVYRAAYSGKLTEPT